MTSVAAKHPQLYHYTTAVGLQGVIENQALWATNIAYLNDAEEHTGFFDRHLPRLHKKVNASLRPKARKDLENLINILPTTIKFHDPYVSSFCTLTPNQNPDDGLLSQWRGYGLDGGYALVFDTRRLEQLFLAEGERYSYTFLLPGEVVYGDDVENHPEASSLINQLAQCAQAPKSTDTVSKLYNPITVLSCLYKHAGFREEAEVRFVATPMNDSLYTFSQKQDDNKPRKTVHFRVKNGVNVPYIKLFEHLNETSAKLPITKIIIGPHPDRFKRKEAVKLLLKQNGMETDMVVVSDIPYLGC